MPNIKVSIVIPSLNQGTFIEETLMSVFDQSYPHYEVILIDGGSTDNTLRVIRAYSDRIDYWVSEPDEGQSHALAKGFLMATGDIFCWLCSDDLLEKNALEVVAGYFYEHEETMVVSGNATWVDREGRILKSNRDIPFNRFLWMYTYNYLIQPATFWRRPLYEAVGGIDPGKVCAMDADLWAKFSSQTRIEKIDHYLARLRLYQDQKNIRLRDISNREDKEIRLRSGINRDALVSRAFLSPVAYAVRIGWKILYGSYFTGNYMSSVSLFRR